MKRMCLFVAAAFISLAAVAQEKPVFGLKAGLNVATLDVDNVNNLDSRLGLHAGLLAHIHITPQWGIQPELLYSAQGMEESITDSKWKLDYINVPVMVQYMFNNGFRLQAGPQIGFLVNGEVESRDGSETEITDDLKKVDAGLGFGFGYLSDAGIGIDARYNVGLSNINESGNDIKNRVFQVGIFYMFDNRHKAKSR
jgi:opacity protein-like surface antigen